jgi:hypothetical protein
MADILLCLICSKPIREEGGYYFHLDVVQPPLHVAKPKPVELTDKERIKKLELDLKQTHDFIQDVKSIFYKEIGRLEEAIRRQGGTLPPREVEQPVNGT